MLKSEKLNCKTFYISRESNTIVRIAHFSDVLDGSITTSVQHTTTTVYLAKYSYNKAQDRVILISNDDVNGCGIIWFCKEYRKTSLSKILEERIKNKCKYERLAEMLNE